MASPSRTTGGRTAPLDLVPVRLPRQAVRVIADLADRHALPPSVAARHVFLAGLVASSVVEMTTRRFHAVPSAFVTWLAHREVTDESR
jgi:hypothetical protein